MGGSGSFGGRLIQRVGCRAYRSRIDRVAHLGFQQRLHELVDPCSQRLLERIDPIVKQQVNFSFSQIARIRLMGKRK